MHVTLAGTWCITDLLTGGFFFKTSAIILLAGGSLFQPEKTEKPETSSSTLSLKVHPLPMLPAPLPRAFMLAGHGSVRGAAGIWKCSGGAEATVLQMATTGSGRSRNMP